jgi:hypothetical protein
VLLLLLLLWQVGYRSQVCLALPAGPAAVAAPVPAPPAGYGKASLLLMKA